ncbi:hypothetical protein [Paratractidigestivibacter sp.]|uniref:hypothetical protein n=1 Tax=Paratractidigestivibacter sp. TaxID=2847316 RepID=UPI002ABD1807|nr:hypothetical protein [Paratractidigestivibacter sp.]
MARNSGQWGGCQVAEYADALRAEKERRDAEARAREASELRERRRGCFVVMLSALLIDGAAICAVIGVLKGVGAL